MADTIIAMQNTILIRKVDKIILTETPARLGIKVRYIASALRDQKNK